jgi:hypothetical protein
LPAGTDVAHRIIHAVRKRLRRCMGAEVFSVFDFGYGYDAGWLPQCR